MRALITITLLGICVSLQAQLLQSDCGETKIQYENQTFSVFCPPILIKTPGATNDAEWGEYMWEFGDGHYSVEEEPKYQYQDKDEYTARVYMLPYYANNLPYKTESSVPGTGNARAPRYSNMSGNEIVGIYTNARNRLVPGNEIRTVLHYRLPSSVGPNTPGYLLFFYNEDGESGLKYAPFRKTYDLSPHYGEREASRAEFANASIPKAARNYLAPLLAKHDVRIFRTPALKVGEDRNRRLFFSMISKPELRSFVPKDPDQFVNDRIQVELTAVFIPEDPSLTFNSDWQAEHYRLTLAKVHDPNRIKVKPKNGTYKKDAPEELEYTVKFQNKGPGEVNALDIKIPWPKNLKVGQLRVQDWSPRPVDKRICPVGFNPEVDRYSCLAIDSSSVINPRLPDTLVFTLYNVSVSGTQQEGVRNKYTKGNLVFTVPNNNKRVDNTKMQALIDFEGGKPMKTNKAKTNWRQKTFGVTANYNIAPELGGYTWSRDKIENNIGAGLYYMRTPLVTGLGWNISLNYNRFHFKKFLAQEFDVSFQSYFEELVFDLVDLEAGMSYQWGGLFRVNATAGISTSFFGTAEIDASQSAGNVTLTDFGESTFGWFQENVGADILGTALESKNIVGFTASIGAEFGRLNDFSVGAALRYRHFPTFYNDVCVGGTGFVAYARINLFSFR